MRTYQILKVWQDSLSIEFALQARFGMRLSWEQYESLRFGLAYDYNGTKFVKRVIIGTSEY
jgi:hypothetical protein